MLQNAFGAAPFLHLPALPGPSVFNAAEDAWETRQRHIDDLARLVSITKGLSECLPNWAKEGPRSINGAGEFSQETSAWPEIENVGLPPFPSAWRVIRPSPFEVKADFEQYVRIFGQPSSAGYQAFRENARAKMRARMRTIVARLRERRRLQEEIGLAAAERGIGLAIDGIVAADSALQYLQDSPDKRAAIIMMRVSDDCERIATIEGDFQCATMFIAAIALEQMLPDLSGLIQEHASFFVSNPTVPLAEMPFAAA
ncbi:hypothetical protein [Bradyrhizobium sp. LA7.1]|uniref:hypothetical protein n=1 Tax=Bradyrhizobium sp. LA7.1 TaxID=3156324 RepID=UPI0033939097